MKYFLVSLLFLASASFAQKLKKSDKEVIENLKKEITYLASDQLQGRRTGTEGEKLAYQYLSSQFKKAGLAPKGDDDSYIQSFQIDEGKQILTGNSSAHQWHDAANRKRFFPFNIQWRRLCKRRCISCFKEKGMPWFWDIKEVLEENQNNPHFDIEDAIRNKALGFCRKRSFCINNLQFRKCMMTD